MTPPLIGITGYGRNEKKLYRLPAKYVDAVRRAGGIPVILPPGESHLTTLLTRLDGIIFSGGGDIHPKYYGGQQHETLYSVNDERDEGDIALARLIVKQGKPTLLICRGIQVLNVALGGTLIEHLPDEVGDNIQHRALTDPETGKRLTPPPLHPVTVHKGSQLYAIIGETCVNPASSHHQAIRELAPDFIPTAYAADGTIEGIEMQDHPWLVGVQWHPEVTAVDDPTQQQIFNEFVKAAVANTNNHRE